MSYMFNDCTSLSSLPDISKWNINNVTDMSYIHRNCISLLNLSDIPSFFVHDLEVEDIEIVMNEGKVSRKEAIDALQKANGDPVEALLNV